MRNSSFPILSLFMFLFSLPSFAQSVTMKPRVESQFQSRAMRTELKEVILREEGTLVVVDFIVPRGYGQQTMGISRNTFLICAGGTYKIMEIGYLDGEQVSGMDLDKPYSLQDDRRYSIALLFPKIPRSTRVISVRENVSGGFFWNGIHLDVAEEAESGSSGQLSPKNTPGGNGPHEDAFSPKGSGTCFAVGQGGYVATCHHVVEEARRIRIRGVGGDFEKTLSAKVIASDPKNDLALLKIDDPSFRGFGDIPYSFRMGTSEVGEDVSVLGYPLRAVMGDEIKLTTGIISSKTGYRGDITSYQISAAVQPGNSGGPLFNKDGEIIGVVNARLGVESAAYAVKASYLSLLADSLPNSVSLSSGNTLSGRTLPEMVKRISSFIYIIEIE